MQLPSACAGHVLAEEGRNGKGSGGAASLVWTVISSLVASEEVLEKAKDYACSDHGFASILPELAGKVVAAIRDGEAATA